MPYSTAYVKVLNICALKSNADQKDIKTIASCSVLIIVLNFNKLMPNYKMLRDTIRVDCVVLTFNNNAKVIMYHIFKLSIGFSINTSVGTLSQKRKVPTN